MIVQSVDVRTVGNDMQRIGIGAKELFKQTILFPRSFIGKANQLDIIGCPQDIPHPVRNLIAIVGANIFGCLRVDGCGLNPGLFIGNRDGDRHGEHDQFAICWPGEFQICQDWRVCGDLTTMNRKGRYITTRGNGQTILCNQRIQHTG